MTLIPIARNGGTKKLWQLKLYFRGLRSMGTLPVTSIEINIGNAYIMVAAFHLLIGICCYIKMLVYIYIKQVPTYIMVALFYLLIVICFYIKMLVYLYKRSTYTNIRLCFL